MVRVEGMTAQAWEMDGRNGMAFRASAIRSMSARRRARRRRRDDRRARRATGGRVAGAIDGDWVALVVGVVGALWRLSARARARGWRCSCWRAGAAVGPGRARSRPRSLAGRRWSRRVLAVPGGRGGWLLRALRAARVRRAWWRAWTDCELPRVRAGRVTDDPGRRAGPGARVARVVAGARRAARRGAGGVPAGARGPCRARPRQRGDAGRSRWCGAIRSRAWCRCRGRTATRRRCRCGSRSRSASTSSARRSRVALPERNVLMGGEPGAGKSAALSVLVATAALDPSRAAVAARRQAGRAVGVGAVRAAARRARTSTRRSSCCASCARRWRRATASCSPAASARSRARTGCRCTWWRATSWRSTSAREDRKKQTRVRRAAARPRRPRPRGRRDRLRRDAEAGVRRRAVGAAGPVRVPAGAALQHAAGLGHDPRPGLGHARAQRGDDRARATRRRAAAGRGRHAASACAAFT